MCDMSKQKCMVISHIITNIPFDCRKRIYMRKANSIIYTSIFYDQLKKKVC